MHVVLNGKAHRTRAATLADLLAAEAFPPEAVATAVNGAFVPREERAATRLAEGDRVEVLTPRQGG